MPRNYTIPIPSPSLAAFRARDRNKPQNPGLIFDRFSPDWREDSTLKRDGLETVFEAAGHADRELFDAWVERWKQDAVSIQAKTLEMVSDWRFVAGLGRKGSLETGFTFNRYGFPYLPGSSVKGLARMAALVNVTESLGADKRNELNELDEILSKEDDQDGEEDDKKFKKSWHRFTGQENPSALAITFRRVFGTTNQAGAAIFLDAIPSSLPSLELDIMNPHYPDYYQGKAPPTNWQSPQPITFLTVAARTPFLFAVGWRRQAKMDTDAFKKAAAWLQTGLENLGAGAKTSAGYGYFVERTGDSGASSQQAQATSPRSLPTGYERGVVRVGIDSSQSAGWITRSNGADIFVHRSCLADGRTTLEKGQRVTFKEGLGPNGKKQAQDVRPE
jgi:CRISPR-associated protein Cmr6